LVRPMELKTQGKEKNSKISPFSTGRERKGKKGGPEKKETG